MDSILEKCQDSKNPVLIDGCVILRVCFVFRWKINLWWNVVPREDQRLRERGRGMKKERTMSERHQVSDWFLLLQKTIGTRMFTRKGEKISNVLTDCVEIVVSVIILRKMLGTFEWMLSMGRAHTWYSRTFKLLRIWVHSVYPVVEPHKWHNGFCGVKG